MFGDVPRSSSLKVRLEIADKGVIDSAEIPRISPVGFLSIGEGNRASKIGSSDVGPSSALFVELVRDRKVRSGTRVVNNY